MCVSGVSPRRRAGVAEILVVMAMLLAFWGGVGAGSRHPSAFTPLAGVGVGEAGGGPLGRLLPERGDGAMLDHFAARGSATGVPGPSLGFPPPPALVSQPPAALGWHPFSGRGPGALTRRVGQRGPGVAHAAD